MPLYKVVFFLDVTQGQDREAEFFNRYYPGADYTEVMIKAGHEVRADWLRSTDKKGNPQNHIFRTSNIYSYSIIELEEN
jgi:hypothetical protein